MEKPNKKLIMFIGKTHSGKTTFAKEIEKRNENVIILEADPIALFLNDKFPRLKKSESKNLDGSFKKLTLRFEILLLFIKKAMSFGKPIILSNSNIWKKGRDRVFKIAKKFDYKIVGVYFDFPEDFLVKRINKSNRTKKILHTSKNFHELIERQRARVRPPDPKDFYKFFIIQSEKDLGSTKDNLLKILK